MKGTDISGSYTAIYPSAPITLRNRFNQTINVRDYGAKCDNSTDDRDAFEKAINKVNSLELAGTRAVIYIPPGMCLIKGTKGALPQFATNTQGGVIGDGTFRSWVIMDSSYTGDLFSWSEAWMSNTFPFNGNTVLTSSIKTGPLVSGLSIVGNRSASATQYALHFYNHVDQALIENVDMFYIKGGCISTGQTTGGGTAAGIRESALRGVRCWNSGDTGVPAIEFNNAGVAGGGPVKGTDIDIYAPYGPGMVIRSMGAQGLGNYFFSKLRIEGLESNPAGIAADLLVVGDALETGSVGPTSFDQLELLSPYAGFCAMKTDAPSSPLSTVGLSVVSGEIETGGGAGKGLCLNGLRSSSLQFTGITSADTNVTLGPLVGANVTIDGNGANGPAQWTYSFDSAVERLPQTPVFTSGVQGSTKMTFATTIHDGSNTGGNALGAGAVDLQMNRTLASHAATSSNAAIGGGTDNLCAAANCVVSGGNSNQSTGQFSAIPGGSNAADGGRTGLLAFADGQFLVHGDAQGTTTILRGSGNTASAFQLTANGSAANNTSGTANCVNLAANFAFGFSIRLHARDLTTAGTDYDWYLPNAMLTRDASVGSTALAIGTPLALTRGTVTGVAVSATADTTNSCLILSFTPPTGNTDTWHAVARIDAVEVQ